MKTVSLIFIILICILLGVARFYDLSYLTGEDGFVTVMNSGVRYLALLIPIILVMLHSIIFLRKRNRTVSGKGFYIIMLLVGVVHVFASVFFCLYSLNFGYIVSELILVATMFICGLWFSLSGFVSLTSNKMASGPMLFALLGISYYYILMLHNFITTVSSTDRISSILEVLIPMSAVIFLTNLLKQLYSLSKSVSSVSISGIICFLLATSISSAEIVYGIINNTISPVLFMQNIASCSIGVLALYATIYFSKDPKIKVVTIY